MSSPCSVKFIAAATLRMLISAKIEQIDNVLTEISFQQQTGVLAANGSVSFQIIYRKASGRVRRHSGLFQFQVEIPQTIPEKIPPNELPEFEPELIREYFIFHPKDGRLEQSFLLNLWEKKVESGEADVSWQPLRGRQIVSSGNGAALGHVALDFDDGDLEPLNFTGNIRFIGKQELWLKGILTGKIRSCDLNHRLHEMTLEKEIDFFDLEQIDPLIHQNLYLEGEIDSSTFFRPSIIEPWILTVKIKYHWSISETKAIRCRSVPDENQPNSIVIQSFVNICTSSKQISRRLVLPGDIFPTEIHCSIGSHREKPSSNSLVVTADYWVELYGIGPNQDEICAIFQFELIDLIPAPGVLSGMMNLRFDSVLETSVGPFERNDQGVSVVIFFDYQGTVLQSEFYRVATHDGEGAEFLVETIDFQRQFVLMGDETIPINPWEISEITAVSVELSQCRTTPEKGWLKLDGLLAVAVIFVHKTAGYSCKVFELPVRNTFIWDEADQSFETVSRATVESHMMTPNRDGYHFSFLIRLECGLLKNKRVKLIYLEGPDE